MLPREVVNVYVLSRLDLVISPSSMRYTCVGVTSVILEKSGHPEIQHSHPLPCSVPQKWVVCGCFL